MNNDGFIEILSPKALADLDKLNSMLVETVSSVDKVSQKFKNITTPSGVDSGLKGLTAEYAKQEKLIVELQIKLQQLAKAQQQTIISTNNAEASTIRLNNQRDKGVKALEREQAKLEASANLYNKVQAKMNALSNEYKALATRKELFNNLTAKEEQRYTSLQTRIQKYDQTLKAVDASMGKYQRNVGNYASGFNPLSNSINQLTREAPAFANSVQTGFMAISNNLPIFFDAMGDIIRQNKELQAQGQPTKSVLSQLASSVLSWGTALSVAVTLLTVYGKDIVEFVSGLTEAEKKQKELNNAIAEASTGYNETALRIETLTKVVKDNAETEENRLVAYRELQKTIPELEKMTMQQAIATGYLTEITDLYIRASIKRAMADKFASKIAEEQIKLDIKRAKRMTAQGIGEEMTFWENISGIDPEKYNKRMKEQEGAMEDYINTLKKLYKQSLVEAERLENSILGGPNKKPKKPNLNREINEQREPDKGSLQAMEDMISSLEKELKLVEYGTVAYDALEQVLSILKKSYEALQDAMKDKEPLEIQSKGIAQVVDASDLLHKSARANIKDLEEQKEKTDKQKEALEKLNQIMKEYVTGFSADFFSRSGFPTLFKALNGEILGFGKNWEVTFQAIGEIAQETFNFVSQLSQQKFQQEYENLQREKEIAIAFAGDSATAREEIERQYQERQREIKRREFKAKQQEAMFNIAIDTAQAIVGAIAKSPLTGGMPWTAIIATLGAIQLGVVASQQIPQFWKGTDNAPEGWAWTQERGREIITDKHGRIKSTGSDSGAKLTYLNKGDKVFDATKSALMFDSALNSMLMDRGISMPKVEVSNALNENHVNRIVKAVQSIDPVSLNIDKGGLNAYVGNGHSRKELVNMRVRGLGRSV